MSRVNLENLPADVVQVAIRSSPTLYGPKVDVIFLPLAS